MPDKNIIRKSPEKRNQEHIEFWTEFNNALKHQEVEVTFKFGNSFFPETMNSVGSPYLCAFSEKLDFYRFEPQKIHWKNTLVLKTSFLPTEIKQIKMDIKKGNDLILSVFPVETSLLQINIHLCTGETFNLYSKGLSASKKINTWCLLHEVNIDWTEAMEKYLS